MHQLLNKLGDLFTLRSPLLLYPGVWLCVAVIWFLVIGCTLTSVFSRPFSRRKKVLWALVVVGVPLVGVLAYLPVSLNEELFPLLGIWRKPRQ